VIDKLRAVNVATVIASGNNGSNNGLSTPGCISTAIAVGSSNDNGTRSSFSNVGSTLGVFAPGASITAPKPGGGTVSLSGTSMAAPHVAGAIALLKQKAVKEGKAITVDDYISLLQQTGSSVSGIPQYSSALTIRVDRALDKIAAGMKFPTVFIVDDYINSSGISLLSGAFTASAKAVVAAYGGAYYQATTAGAASVKFTPNLAENGTYKVSVRYPVVAGAPAAVTADIKHTGGAATKTLNQTTTALSGVWQSLGEYNFAKGTSGSVSLSATTGQLVYDAVKFEYMVGAVAPSPTPVPTPTPTPTPTPVPTPTPTPDIGGWYNDSWTSRLPLSIKKDSFSENLSDFPVYIDLSTLPESFWNGTKEDCADIRITTSNGKTELPREIVSCEKNGKKGELHFKADSLSSTQDSLFHLYYGNTSASDYATNATYGAENVWTNGFVGVYHMAQDPTTKILDSTSSNKDGATSGFTSGQLVDAVVGKGIDFSGASGDDVINIGNWDLRGKDLSVSAITRMDKMPATDDYPSIVGDWDINGKRSWGLANRRSLEDAKFWWSVDETGTYSDTSFLRGTTKPSLGSWNHIVGTWNKTTGVLALYVNGKSEASPETKTANNLFYDANNRVTIGSVWANGTYQRFYDGIIDEVRISNVVRPASWISAEYKNQKAPSSFMEVGGVQNL
jgi:hypothetical protein